MFFRVRLFSSFVDQARKVKIVIFVGGLIENNMSPSPNWALLLVLLATLVEALGSLWEPKWHKGLQRDSSGARFQDQNQALGKNPKMDGCGDLETRGTGRRVLAGVRGLVRPPSLEGFWHAFLTSNISPWRMGRILRASPPAADTHW